jgi:hypothetical protein
MRKEIPLQSSSQILNFLLERNTWIFHVTQSYSLRHCNRGSCDVCLVIHVPSLLISVFSKFILSDELSAMPPQGISWTKELVNGCYMYVCMYVWINSESMCVLWRFFFPWKNNLWKLCAVWSFLSCVQKCLWNVTLLFFWGQFVQSKVCFVKVIFHQVHTIIKRLIKSLSICAPCEVAFDLCICFLIYVLLEGTDVNSVGHQPLLCMCKVDVCGYAKVVMCATLA